MSGNQLPISDIINISVANPSVGAGNYNTSNLAIFSDEVPANSFGTAGYKAYVEPVSVGTDFGTSSKTYAMAIGVFSQQPNILNGGGQLIVVLMGVAIENWTFSGLAASGTFVANFGGNASAAINWNDTASAIQTKLRAVPGLSAVTVSGSISSETIAISMAGVYGLGAVGDFTFTSNGLMTGTPSAITITNSVATAGQALHTSIQAAASLVQFFGILATETMNVIGQAEILTTAGYLQTVNKIGFFVTTAVADIQPAGTVDLLATGGFTQTRGLYYGDTTTVSNWVGLNAITFAAAYAGLGLSVNFEGSNTTITMNLQSLATVQADPSMSQTIYNYAKASGADIYPSIQGVAKVLCNGANKFYDSVYNLRWFVGAVQVSMFNFLAEAGTKQPQTESGMDGLKGSIRAVCEQAVTNQYLAPGTWTNPTTFGNQKLLYANIQQLGYYIYSQPIAQQSQASRVTRVAPLAQLGIKEAGALQSADLIIYVNQ